MFANAFRVSVATNGLVPIPQNGFENLAIGVSLWGDEHTDSHLRGRGRRNLFSQARANYRNDSRAFFYYTVAPGFAHEIEGVVERCVENGNRVLFNFYGDIDSRGGPLDSGPGFGAVEEAISNAIDRFPEHVLMTSPFARVVSSGRLFDEVWGHPTCTSISPDHPANLERIANGKPFNRHFRAYNADLATTRRCCTGIDRGCDTCFDTWEHFSWVMLNLKKHLETPDHFTQWLTTTYLFYFINRLVDVRQSSEILTEIHRRTRPVAPETRLTSRDVPLVSP